MNQRRVPHWIERVGAVVRAKDGVLTQELVREPGGFGLGQVPTRFKPEAIARVVCGFCSTGCGLDVHLRAGEAVSLTPATDYPVNLGMACPKGWESLTPLRAPDRATTPLLRDKSGKLNAVSWEQAIETFVTRMKEIQANHGREAAAFLSTGQIPTEEMALLGALAKFGMGLIHGDGNTRQCMATSVVAYKEAFGFDAPPYTYADFEQSDVLFFIGANPCIAHPIMWERVCRNPNNPKIIVIDPRRTETAQAATEHVALQPKSDLALLYAIANVLIRNDWIDRRFIEQHTVGFDGFSEHVRSYTPVSAAEASGVPAQRIEDLAKTIHEGKRVSFWWTMGVNQSHEGVRVAQAIINLALMTGNIGRPGMGANSITGQCNAMGSRLFSNTTNLLGGHAFQNPAHRRKVAEALSIDVERIPERPSVAYDQIMEGILAGRIRGLWIIATNTAHSWINQADAQEVLRKLDFLVVQDMYRSTETAMLADLVLPAAGWGEKEGTFINSERRIARIKQVARAPGQALSDFRILRLIAEGWGCGSMFQAWSSPEAVFQLIKQCSRDMPCDITGIRDYAMLEEHGGVQWPLREGETLTQGERRLFEDGRFFTEDGRARFCFEHTRPLPEKISDAYPFLLLTGRGSSSQWHTQTRTSKSSVLQKLAPNTPYVELSSIDAGALGIAPDEWVVVRSQRGAMKARAFIGHLVQPGHVFIPMHFAKTNLLTFAAFDPYSRQPAYKACAVRVDRFQGEDRGDL